MTVLNILRGSEQQAEDAISADEVRLDFLCSSVKKTDTCVHTLMIFALKATDTLAHD